MEPVAILYADHLDLLFEHRNKLYGAYPLRKYYSRRLYTAMAIVIGLVLIFSCSVIYMRSKAGFSGGVISTPENILSAFTIDPDVKPPVLQRPAIPIKHTATAAFNTPLIERNQTIPEPMATVEELKVTAIGIHAEAGPAGAEVIAGQGGPSFATGNQLKDSVEKAPEIFDHADVMPEFPGGSEALKRFLLKNLRMPGEGPEPGTQVRVVARFVVGADGKVTGINMSQSGGPSFDKEVQRVIGLMPNWKPGMQNHKNVCVYFYLPVNFRAAAEN